MEYRRRCNVCGKIYCYSDKDVQENKDNSSMAALSHLGALASVFCGTRLDMYALDNMGRGYSAKVVDYNKCPFCNSTDTSALSEEEWNELQQKEASAAQAAVIETKKLEINSNATAESLLKRTKMFLEDEEWESASTYCEHILDIEPECAMAYVYKLMIELNVSEQDQLAFLPEPFSDNKLYQKAIRFADDSLRTVLEGYNNTIVQRNYEKKALDRYNYAVRLLQQATTEKEFLEAKAAFDSISSYYDVSSLSMSCMDKAEEARKNAIYDEAITEASSNSIPHIEYAITVFRKIPGWKDADAQIYDCYTKIENIKAQEEVDRIERERQEAERRIAEEKATKKRKRTIVIVTPIVVACIALGVLLTKVIIPKQKMNKAMNLLDSGDYDAAINILEELGKYKDSETIIIEAKYQKAKKLFDNKQYADCIALLEKNLNLLNSTEAHDYLNKARYHYALELVSSDKYSEALNYVIQIETKDEDATILKTYLEALQMMDNGNYNSAIPLLEKCVGFDKADEKYTEAIHSLVESNLIIAEEYINYEKHELTDEAKKHCETAVNACATALGYCEKLADAKGEELKQKILQISDECHKKLADQAYSFGYYILAKEEYEKINNQDEVKNRIEQCSAYITQAQKLCGMYRVIKWTFNRVPYTKFLRNDYGTVSTADHGGIHPSLTDIEIQMNPEGRLVIITNGRPMWKLAYSEDGVLDDGKYIISGNTLTWHWDKDDYTLLRKE